MRAEGVSGNISQFGSRISGASRSPSHISLRSLSQSPAHFNENGDMKERGSLMQPILKLVPGVPAVKADDSVSKAALKEPIAPKTVKPRASEKMAAMAKEPEKSQAVYTALAARKARDVSQKVGLEGLVGMKEVSIKGMTPIELQMEL